MARVSRAERGELTPQQIEALELLLAGHTISETAAALGVARETVSRWRNSNATFEAAYNDGLTSAWDASHKRLMDARAKAITKLEELIDATDEGIALKAAAALVKIDIPRPRGSSSVSRVAMAQMLEGA